MAPISNELSVPGVSPVLLETLKTACTDLSIDPASFLSLKQPTWYALAVHHTRSLQGVTVATPPFHEAVLKFLQVERQIQLITNLCT